MDRNHEREDNSARLAQIAREVRNLTESPLYSFRQAHGYQPVVGAGNPDADLLLIGEAPGKQEAETGMPFVGRAGRVLDDLLRSIAVNRDDLYITSVLKDRPPNNRDPRVAEIELYAPFLMRQIQIIRPAIIATLGRVALNFILTHCDMVRPGATIGEVHGRVFRCEAAYGAVTLVPLYHPAATFYNRRLTATLNEDFQVLGRELQRS